jgi:hypothetical protein
MGRSECARSTPVHAGHQQAANDHAGERGSCISSLHVTYSSVLWCPQRVVRRTRALGQFTVEGAVSHPVTKLNRVPYLDRHMGEGGTAGPKVLYSL